jgi:hypothetical protein
MEDKNDLPEPAKGHCPSKHAHILLSVIAIQRSQRFVPEQRFVTNALTLPHVVDGDAQIHGFIDQYELPARKLIYKARAVQILFADLL